MREDFTRLMKNPTVERVVIGAFVLMLLVTAVASFFQYAGSPTDENIFIDNPSRVIVTHNMKGKPVEPPAGTKWSSSTMPEDQMLRKGDVVVGVGEAGIRDSLDLAKALSSAGQTVTIVVYRPTSRASFAFRVERSNIGPDAFMQLPPTVAVTDVTVGGASDRAGIRVGDLITRINGQGFQNALGADLQLRRGQIGGTILYEMYRDGEPLTVAVTLAKFGFPLAVLIISLAGVFYVLFGSFLALRRPYITAARLVGLAFACLGFFLAVTAARRDSDVTVFVAYRYTLMTACLYFGVALFGVSSMYFPRERPEMLAVPWIRRVLYGIAAVAVVASLLVVNLMPGPPYEQMIMLGGIGSMVLLTVGVHIAFRKKRTPEHRKLGRVISLTGAVVVVLIVAVSLLWRDKVAGFTALLLFAIPLSYLYTIGRYRLLDMNLRIRRNTVYAVMTSLWGIFVGALLIGAFLLLPMLPVRVPVVAVTGASIEITDPTPEQEQQVESARKVVLMVLAVGIWYALWRARKSGQKIINRKFDRTEYDYRRAANELADVMSTHLSMVDLGRGIAKKLAELMRLKRAAVLFFRDENVCCCEEAYGIQETEWGKFCSAQDLALMRAVSNFSGEFRADYLAPGLKDSLRSFGFHQLVPVRSRDQLIGVFLLGEKLSEATYSQEDLSFLAAAARQSSVAIENAFLYEEIAEKERMKHELEIARRIQMASLPQRTPHIPGLSIAGESVPALEVGGDFYDYLDGEERGITVVVGDVSGKGTSAALYMSKIQGILRSLHGFERSPGGLLKRANRLLFRDMERKSFVTVIAAAFDPVHRSVSLARAGHLPLYRYVAARNCVERVVPGGLGLGLNDTGVFSSELQEESLSYGPGDVMVFVTDGVTEARGDGSDEEFGERRLMDLLQKQSSASASAIRDAIVQAVRGFAGDAPPHDDATVVVVKAEANGATPGGVPAPLAS